MTAPTKPNAELAYRVLDHIDAEPKGWEQGMWIGKSDCGTVACFAGWAVLLSGCQVDSERAFEEVVGGPAELIGKGIPQAADILLGISIDYLRERDLPDPYDGLHSRESLGAAIAEIFGPRPCDADAPTLGPDGQCTCLVCSKCGHHTGNSHQGHYWRACKVTGTDREFHFCCPDACELEANAEGGAS